MDKKKLRSTLEFAILNAIAGSCQEMPEVSQYAEKLVKRIATEIMYEPYQWMFANSTLIADLVDVLEPLLEGYCNMTQTIHSECQFMGDQLTQQAKALIERAK